jgi:hypothetical protein
MKAFLMKSLALADAFPDLILFFEFMLEVAIKEKL